MHERRGQAIRDPSYLYRSELNRHLRGCLGSRIQLYRRCCCEKKVRRCVQVPRAKMFVGQRSGQLERIDLLSRCNCKQARLRSQRSQDEEHITACEGTGGTLLKSIRTRNLS